MDPITLVGFASGILTFLDFSATLVRGTYELYQSTSGTTVENAHISNVIADLHEASEELHLRVKADGQDRHAKALSKLAQKCLVLSDELTAILEKLQVKEKNRKWQSVKATWTGLVKQSTIASIEKRLGTYRSEIVLRLNLMICSQNSSVRKSLEKIEQDCSQIGRIATSQHALCGKLRDLIQQLQEDDLPSPSAELAASVSDLEKLARHTQLENIVLRSLYFDSMFLRENSVGEPEEGTFNWLLKQIIDSSLSSSVQSATDSQESEVAEIHSQEGDIGGHEVTEDLHSDEDRNPGSVQHPVSEQGSDVVTLSGSDGRSIRSTESPSEDTRSLRSIGEIQIDELEHSARRDTAEAFESFLREDRGLFFICGKAGSGKSTMMKYVGYSAAFQNELERWSDDRNLIFARFFFWNSGDRMQMSLEGFYRSLLFVVLKQCPNLIPVVLPDAWSEAQKLGTFDDRQVSFDDRLSVLHTLSSLKDTMQHLIQTGIPETSLFLMIDGLDEYEGDPLEHFELARLLQRWSRMPNTKVICSARPHTEFIDTFNAQHRVIQLHELTRGDIRWYAHAQFNSRIPQSIGSETTPAFDAIVEQIVDMADGVFLWARLVVRSLLVGMVVDDSPKALMERLNSTPRDINRLFQRILGSVDPTVRHRSDQMLSMALDHPFDQDLNALLYSWLENLDDPNFPYNQPFEALAPSEVHRRHHVVRHQLDVLTRGLLELKRQEMSPRSPSLSHGLSIYWKYSVCFLHRSVKDFLRNHWSRDASHRTVSFHEHIRLRLAEAQFGASLDFVGIGTIGDQLRTICHDVTDALEASTVPRDGTRIALQHLGSIIEHYSSLYPASQTGKGGEFWANRIVCSRGFIGLYRPVPILDYLEWLAAKGLGWYVQEQLEEMALNGQDTVNLRRRLLATTCAVPDAALVRYLFRSGLSPATRITISTLIGSRPTGTLDLVPKSERTVTSEAPVFLVYLWMYLIMTMARTTGRHCRWIPSTLHPDFDRVLQEYIIAGARQQDVVILGYLSSPPMFDERIPPTDLDSIAVPADADVFYMELDQLLSTYPFRDEEVARNILVPPKRSWRVWDQTPGLLAKFTAWSVKRNSIRDGLRLATADELKHPNLAIRGVVSEDFQLIGGFEFMAHYIGCQVRRE